MLSLASSSEQLEEFRSCVWFDDKMKLVGGIMVKLIVDPLLKGRDLQIKERK